MTRITLKQLDVLVHVAREGSVTRAADCLSLTQSATSMALSDLEHLLGARLFDRVGRRLQLNALGEQLLPLAQDTVARAQEIESLALADTPGAGRLRLAASLTIGNYVMPALMGQFLTDHPQAQLALDVQNTRHVIESVRAFRSDLGFIEGSCQDPELEVTPWREDELVVFAAVQHPLAQLQKITWEQLAEADWILREPGSGTREVFDQLLGSYLGAVRVRLELSHGEAVQRAVEAGIGLGCASRLTLSDSLAQGRIVEIPAPQALTRTFYQVVHRKKYASPIQRAFSALCLNTVNQPHELT